MNSQLSIPVIDVCAAVVVRDRRALLGQRPDGAHLAGKWEFPGGKVHRGESFEDCIVRELEEELSLTVHSPRFLTSTVHATAKKTVRLHFLECQLGEGAVHECREHQAVGWFSTDEMERLDLAPADRDFILWLRQHSETLNL